MKPIAYLCNRYPAISMTFVQREVQGLRDLRIPVQTMSIRAPHAEDLISTANREAAGNTYVVVPPRWTDVIAAHLRAVTTRPGRYLHTLRLSLTLSSGGPRAALWRVFYFVEAIVVWRRCRIDGTRHMHAHFANVACDVALLCTHFADRPDDPWSWSFTLHGPVEFYDVYRANLSEKIARARFVICISDFARSQAMAWCEESEWAKLRVVHCGIDPSEWSTSPTSQPPGGPATIRLHVLSVGRLIALKGHAVLIDAIAQLRAKDGLAVQATLIGDGPRRAALEALSRARGVADLVDFVGAVGGDDIRRYYAQADVFCLASFAEGVPVVFMEAMAMGVPVIATRIMGVPELIEDGVSGLLMAPGRADVLGELLLRLSRDPELRQALGRAGRERVVAEFDTAKTSRQLADVMEQYGVLTREPESASPLANDPAYSEETAPTVSAGAPAGSAPSTSAIAASAPRASGAGSTSCA
jgi:glycosyltransferase involved in cell wall biosynthesis